MSTIADIFGSSPVQPLEKHMTVVVDCASRLPDFFEAAFAGDWDRASDVRERILALEAGADGLKNELRLALPRSLFMPVKRDDLLELLTAQDEIANTARYISNIVLARRMTFPEALHESVLAFTRQNLEAAEQACTSIRELDELATTVYSGNAADIVAGMIKKLDELETAVEDTHFRLQQEIYALEDSVSPTAAVFLYQVTDLIARVGYKAEQVGRHLELLLSR